MRNYNSYIITYGIGAIFFLVLLYLPVTNPFCCIFCVFATLVCALHSIGYLITNLYHAFMGNHSIDVYAAKRQAFVVIVTLSFTLVFCLWLGFGIYSPQHNRTKEKKVQIDENN